MKTSHKMYLGALLLSALSIVGAQTVERNADGDEEFVPVFEVEAYGGDWITGDTNSDGRIDHAVQLNEFGDKKFEVMDFNSDGWMDDFYIYSNGVLSAEQLDTNYDGRIDLWIHMHDGVRVEGYERDTDYDGEIDVVKEFGE